MYLEQLYNKLKRPLKIFVNQIDLWDDFKEYNISQYCEFYIYITSSFSLHRFRNYNNIHPIYQLPKNQKFEGILINSEYIYNKLKETNTFNFIITNNYLNSLDKKNIIEVFQYQFIIYKSQQNIETDNINIIPEEQTNIDHTIYLLQKNFAQNYKPKVFIITPIYNQSEWTIKCIDSINKYAEQKYDITHVLVDNGSNEQNKNNLNQFLKNIHNIKIHFINFDKPIGFVKTTNAGIKYALQHNADYIDLQNNDTEVSYNWMSKLINGLHGQIVAASPIIIQAEYLNLYNYCIPNFPIQNINISTDAATNLLEQTYNNKIITVFQNKNQYHLGTACFCCTMFKSDIFKKFLLDECFGIGYADDADYCQQLLNYNLGFAHVLNCAVTHFSQKTFSTVIDKNKIIDIQQARLQQAFTINKLNKYQEKTTVIYTINLNPIINQFNDYKYYDFKNNDYIYITIPENINKISSNWKIIDISKFYAIFQDEKCKTNDDIINYLKLNPNFLFRNYKETIYIDKDYSLDIFPYLLKNFIKNNNYISILNNGQIIKSKLTKTNINKFKNIWEQYKNKQINIIQSLKKNFQHINFLNIKRLLNNKSISLKNISIYIYCDFDIAGIVAYYREIQPYMKLKQLGYSITFINTFNNIDYSKIDYLVLNRNFPIIFYKNQKFKNTLLLEKNKYKFKIIYNIDDLLYDLPKYNPACNIMFNAIPNKQTVIQCFNDMYNNIADIIIPTTNYFKQHIHKQFNINKEKIYPINNLISNEIIHYKNITEHNISNPIKIGIIGNNTHITNSGIQDDYTLLYNWFQENLNKYQFYFFGEIPNELRNKSNCFYCGRQ